MNTKKFSDAMNEIDDKYVDEAIRYQKKKKNSSLIKWTSIAACFALVAVLGIGALQGWFGNNNDIATLNNGDKIIFSKSDTAGSSLSLAFDMTTRELTKEETRALFADLPVAANAIFTADDKATGNTQELIGFEGKIGEVKLIITTSDLPLLDTTIVGSEKATEVDGVSVTAEYFLTDPNSIGEQTTIYYATFKVGSSTIYVENAGTKAESETVKNDLAAVIQKLIGNGELELNSFETSEVTAKKVTFEATVTEIRENALVIEPLEGTAERQFAKQFIVDTSNLGELNTVEYVATAQVGDIIRIGYLADNSDVSKGQLAVYEIVFMRN